MSKYDYETVNQIIHEFVYDQFEKLVSPGHYASAHFDVQSWDIKTDIFRLCKSHSILQKCDHNDIVHGMIKGEILWNFLIGKSS